ncbi:hypothetical protein [Promicromonospora soli]|uniref:Uncharacterized protein n=1 Tax=Promicromonospora soli TaxID=2035533 RepID=A0A919FI73_9MICO|nr:hypothetical protein [Promicromonospora soli]GHH65456.1 hypothetical protein GCM10017772_03710 [Promicromonospora soli]
MAEAMLHSHFPLQALLYGVVLHRYLRRRLPGYDPDTHLLDQRRPPRRPPGPGRDGAVAHLQRRRRTHRNRRARRAPRTADVVGEDDETVRLAVALAVRAVRQGSVCVDLGAFGPVGLVRLRG